MHLKKDSPLIAILRNSGWIISEKLLRLVFGVAISAWVARYFGPSQFGELAYVIAFIGIFQSMATLGLENIIVRDLAVGTSPAGDLLGTTFFLKGVAGVVTWFIAISIIGFVEGSGSKIHTIAMLVGATLIFQAADTVDIWFQSQSQSRRTMLVKMVAYLFSCCIKIILILNNVSLTAFSAVIAIEALINAIGLFIAYRKFPCLTRWNVLLSLAKRLLKESWPYIFSGISTIVYMRIDQIMIKNILGDQQLGVYAAVLPLATIWQVLPTTLMISLAPYVAKRKLESDAAYWKTLEAVFKGFALLGWATCIITWIIAAPLIKILLGAQYQGGIAVVMVYVLTNLSINMGVAQNLWIFNEKGRAIVALHKTLAGAVACIVLNLVMLEQLNIIGAALASVISMAISAIFSNVIYSQKILKIQLKSLTLYWVFNLKNRRYLDEINQRNYKEDS